MVDVVGKMWAVGAAFGRAVYSSIKKDGYDRIKEDIAASQMNRPGVQFIQVTGWGGVVCEDTNNGGTPTMAGSGVMAASSRDTIGAQPQEEEQYIAVIPIMGVLTRYGEACSWGTEDISRWLTQAENDDRIAGVMLMVDSPGGEVNGIEILGDQIFNFSKPIESYVKNTAASGAFWLVTRSKKIWIEPGVGKTLGSMGVYTVHAEIKTFEKKNGLKVEMIRATTSPEKAKGNPWEAMDDTTRMEIKEVLDSIHERFCAKVLEGRGDKLKDFEQLKLGKTYNETESVKKGLADAIGTMEDCAKDIFKMAKKQG